jgi:hypothetical protein
MENIMLQFTYTNHDKIKKIYISVFFTCQLIDKNLVDNFKIKLNLTTLSNTTSTNLSLVI